MGDNILATCLGEQIHVFHPVLVNNFPASAQHLQVLGQTFPGHCLLAFSPISPCPCNIHNFQQSLSIYFNQSFLSQLTKSWFKHCSRYFIAKKELSFPHLLYSAHNECHWRTSSVHGFYDVLYPHALCTSVRINIGCCLLWKLYSKTKIFYPDPITTWTIFKRETGYGFSEFIWHWKFHSWLFNLI